MKDKVYHILPHPLQCLLVTIYDILQYRKRHGGVYKEEKVLLRQSEFLSFADLRTMQETRLANFLNYCKHHSKYYKDIIEMVPGENAYQTLGRIPLSNKEALRTNECTIRTISKKGAFMGQTGGTTGKSLQVLFTPEDAQKRFAMLDVFRERFGYQFGMKTAWFSGKDLLTKRDITSNRFWKLDYFHKIKYYSTFHISDKYLGHYIDDLRRYAPKYLVGFPSSIVEIARYGLRHNLEPLTSVLAIFPTAESKVDTEVKDIKAFFGAEVRDQYASSEGANFITECEAGNLHYEMLTGVIEVVDDDGLPSNEGRMLLTSFTTRGTPLIRYDIGDRIRWSTDKNCDCGRKTPLVDEILGRVNDYILSPDNGKINLGNLSNCVKNITEIVKFQVIQKTAIDLVVKVVKGKHYSFADEKLFLKELRARVGASMTIELSYVNDIPVEKSGKYKMIKNLLVGSASV